MHTILSILHRRHKSFYVEGFHFLIWRKRQLSGTNIAFNKGISCCSRSLGKSLAASFQLFWPITATYQSDAGKLQSKNVFEFREPSTKQSLLLHIKVGLSCLPEVNVSWSKTEWPAYLWSPDVDFRCPVQYSGGCIPGTPRVELGQVCFAAKKEQRRPPTGYLVNKKRTFVKLSYFRILSVWENSRGWSDVPRSAVCPNRILDNSGSFSRRTSSFS